MNPTFVVDRIEGDVLIVVHQDTAETLNIPHALAPSLKEGDVFSVQASQSAKDNALQEAEARLERLKAKSSQPQPGDTFDL